MGVKRYERHGASIYKTPRWKALRFQAKRRDGFKCVLCGATGRLNVDHIKPLRTHPELAFDLANLQTLCVPCHSAKTKTEVGFETPTDPRRQAWKKLIYELSKPKDRLYA
jgi:5-methylcytosine-specific restriction enzyme A